MKRSIVVARLLPLAAIALVLALSSCRSPVQGRAEGSLSLNLSIPADLSSDVPEPIRRAIGEAELAGSRPRFIHPDGKTVKAVVTKADGSEAGIATASINAGDTSATLSITDLPLNEPLTLTVTVYDASNAIVGERVILGLVLDSREPKPLSLGVLPYEPTSVSLGTRLETAYSEPVVALSSVLDRLYVYAVELPTSGLYIAKMSVNLDTHMDTQAVGLYDDEGLPVADYVNDPSRQGFGLFTNDAPSPVRHYLMFRGQSAWSGVDVMIHREQQSSMALLGPSEVEPTGYELILFDLLNPIDLGNLSPIDPATYPERTYYLKNLSGKELRLASVSFVGGNSTSFAIPTTPATPLPPEGVSKFIVRFTPTKTGSYESNLVFDSEDPGDIDFTLSFSGSASA